MTEDEVYARQVREIANFKIADAVGHLRAARRAIRSAVFRSAGDRRQRLLSLERDAGELLGRVSKP